MSLSEAEVKGLVEDFLKKQDLKGHRYKFVKVNFDDKHPDEYSAVFNIYTPDDSLIDGPAVFVVDRNSKEVRVL